MKDIETMLKNKDYHSDKISETDDEKAQEEINKKSDQKRKKILINMYS